MKVTFLLKNPKEVDNTIYVRVRIGRAIDLLLATKETVCLSDWDNKNCRLLEEFIEFKNGKGSIKRDAETKEKISENKRINYRLIGLQKLIEDSYKSTDAKLNTEWLRSIVSPKMESSQSTNIGFLDYCDVFLESKGSTISQAYVSKVKTIKNIVYRYTCEKRIKKLLINDIDNNFKNEFERYCFDIEKFSINYFERNFKFIKTIIYHAQQFGYAIDTGISRVKCKTEKSIFVFLTPYELGLIEQVKGLDDHLEVSRDWLLISCHTGQRISDFMRFNTDMIQERLIKGQKRYLISFVQEKTGKQVLLPLSEKVVEILKKRGWNFPRKMSEVKYNQHIKTVCDRAGIDETVEGTRSILNEDVPKQNGKRNLRRKVKGYFPKFKLVSSHIGRRSFASNNFGKIPTPLLMAATGHSSPSMLMKYIGKIDEQQAIALADYL